jgi:hypothetical protein
MAKSMISIKVEHNYFARLAQRLNPRKEEIVKESREHIAEGARRRVHILTGELRDTIRATDSGVEAGTDHALVEEYGMPPNRPAHPYMTPAAEEERPKMIEELRGERLFGVKGL